MPERSVVESHLQDVGDSEKMEFVDLPDFDYWENSEDTVIISIPSATSVQTGLLIGQIAQLMNADELDWKTDLSNGRVVVRMWWD